MSDRKNRQVIELERCLETGFVAKFGWDAPESAVESKTGKRGLLSDGKQHCNEAYFCNNIALWHPFDSSLCEAWSLFRYAREFAKHFEKTRSPWPARFVFLTFGGLVQ
jgi:hypothetical protein